MSDEITNLPLAVSLKSLFNNFTLYIYTTNTNDILPLKIDVIFIRATAATTTTNEPQCSLTAKLTQQRQIEIMYAYSNFH